ncbi:hypothetical protein ACFLWA_03805 [Chloroflexota bacterium]
MRFQLLAWAVAFCHRRSLKAQDLHTFDVWNERHLALMAKLYKS